MAKPDYKKGSLVNLMSSIARAFGGESSYSHLEILGKDELSKSRNIILFIIDGLGYKYLIRKGKGSFLHKNLRGRITSVFPTNTAVCGTTFLTGDAPQQHAVSGWYILDEKFTKIAPPGDAGSIPISQKIKAETYLLFQKDIAAKPYVKMAVGKARLIGYETFDEMSGSISRIIKSGDFRKFIFAHWPRFDDLSHIHGPKSRQLLSHFKELNVKLNAFIRSIEGTDTTMIITADHGQVGINKKIIEPKKHPKLMETVEIPPFGDPRVAFFKVRPSMKKQFERYVTKKLGRYCTLHKSRDLIDQGYFGKFRASGDLRQRIGNYALITKGGFTLWAETNATGKPNKGEHGGTSEEEMFVPLCVIKK